MYRHSRLVGTLVCAATLALVGCATNNSMAPASALSATSQAPSSGSGWIHADNIVYHVPQYMFTRSAAPAHGVIPNVLLSYYGGPVLVNPKMYLIFWGYKKYGDPDGVAKLLKSLCNVQGGSGHNNIYTQYYETSGGSTIYITNPKAQCGGVWDDEKDQIPQYPTDAQVAQEALVGVAHFGYDPSGSYVVATPQGRNSQGFGTAWCAYHSDTYDGGKLVSYTNLPYIPEAAGGNCGSNVISPPKDEKAADEGVTIVEGAEYGASITDPNPGSGWYNFDYGEINGFCEGQDKIQNDKLGKKTYTMQAMFSNANQTCVQTYK